MLFVMGKSGFAIKSLELGEDGSCAILSFSILAFPVYHPMLSSLVFLSIKIGIARSGHF